jgi:hypothetical protein
VIVGQWLHTKRQVVLKVRRGRDRMVVGFTTICATNKTDRHDIAEIMLKVALNTINTINPQPKLTLL